LLCSYTMKNSRKTQG